MLNSLMATTVELTGNAALFAAIGFLIVFGGIAFLIAVVWLIGKVMAYLRGEPVAAQPKKPAAKPKAVESPVAQQLAVADGDEIPEETVAVITAALMSYYQQTKPECGFIVKRIKKI